MHASPAQGCLPTRSPSLPGPAGHLSGRQIRVPLLPLPPPALSETRGPGRTCRPTLHRWQPAAIPGRICRPTLQSPPTEGAAPAARPRCVTYLPTLSLPYGGYGAACRAGEPPAARPSPSSTLARLRTYRVSCHLRRRAHPQTPPPRTNSQSADLPYTEPAPGNSIPAPERRAAGPPGPRAVLPPSPPPSPPLPPISPFFP